MRYLLLFLFCLSGFFVSAQSIKELKARQKKAKQEIELTNKLLNETKKNKNTTVSNLNLLKKQIKERETLIQALAAEINLLDENLQALEAQKALLERRLNSLKKEYAALIYHSYYYQNSNKLNQYLFILSSNSFGESFRRYRYVQEYSDYRKQQSLEIQKVATELSQKVALLAETKKKKELAAAGTTKENENLQSDQKNKEKMLTDLSKKEKQLHADLKKKQKQITELNDKIDRLIAEEIRKAEEKRKADEARRKAQAETQGKKTTPAPTVSSEEGLIAGGFEKNKNRLPWPVKGVITGKFGVHPHPVIKNIEINNKGVYIQTQQNTDAVAIFEGEVTQVFAIPGNNNAIIVKHGIYRSVYANLTATYVRIGDKVSAKQALGKVYVDEENNNKTELYFMLYKNATLLNPEHWLSK